MIKILFCIVPFLLFACSPADLLKDAVGTVAPHEKQQKQQSPINIEIAGPEITVNNYFGEQEEKPAKPFVDVEDHPFGKDGRRRGLF